MSSDRTDEITDSYVRYTYWVSAEERKEVLEAVRAKGKRVKPARTVMCTPLDAFVRASFIAPSGME